MSSPSQRFGELQKLNRVEDHNTACEYSNRKKKKFTDLMI